MTPEQFRVKLKKYKTEFEKNVDKLTLEYAVSNSKIEIGDVIRSHGLIIRVDKITTSKYDYTYDYLPQRMYSGVLLTQKLHPHKNNEIVSIDGGDTVELIGRYM